MDNNVNVFNKVKVQGLFDTLMPYITCSNEYSSLTNRAQCVIPVLKEPTHMTVISDGWLKNNR